MEGKQKLILFCLLAGYNVAFYIFIYTLSLCARCIIYEQYIINIFWYIPSFTMKK